MKAVNITTPTERTNRAVVAMGVIMRKVRSMPMIKKIGSILQSVGATPEQVKEAYDSVGGNSGYGFTTPVNIGDPVFFVLEDDFPVHKWFYSKEKVTEVCSRGFFTSAFYPTEDDFGNYTRYDEIGTEVFLTEEAAIKAVKERMQE